MALTPAGAVHMLRLAAGEVQDPITSVRVSAPGDQASTPVQALEVIPQAGGGLLRVTAVFGESQANFEWLRREVVTRDGVVIDLNLEDGGRKVLGAVWDVVVDIELAAVA